MSNKTLQTNKVFLDTNIFIKYNFNYKNISFIGLLELCSDYDLELYLTDVAELEIQDEIKIFVLETTRIHKDIHFKSRIFSNLIQSYKCDFENVTNTEPIINELLNQFKEFTDEAGVEIIKTKTDTILPTFKNYFKIAPPFDSGKKRKEFTDSFILEALKSYAKNNNSRLYIVSNDGGMRKYCDKNSELIYVNSLNKLLDKFFTTCDPSSELLEKIIRKNYRKIEDEIKENFSEFSFILSDYDGDVEDVNVSEIKILDNYLIKINKNEFSFAIEASVSFDAYISYDDYSAAMYDKEDDKYYFVEKNSDRYDFKMDISFELDAEFEFDSKEKLEVTRVSTIGGTTIDLDLDPNEYRSR